MDRRLLVAVTLLGIVALAIGGAYIARPRPQRGDKLIVVATFYPIAYMAEQIGGDRIEVQSLIQPGIEVHSWQPSAGDLVACSDADVIVYNGAGLDNWLQDDVFPAIPTEGKLIVDTTQNVTLWRNVEQSEIQEHGVYDTHTWVSPYEARQQAEAVYRALVRRDPVNADYYSERWNGISSRLTDLDSSYRTQLQNTSRDTIFVTHDSFGYLARRYGFQQQAIIGLSADQQPSTQTIASIVDLMIHTDTYIFYLEPGYSDAYLQTVKTELQARTGRDVTVLKLYHMNGPLEGLDYLQQMERNLVNLAEGLG